MKMPGAKTRIAHVNLDESKFDDSKAELVVALECENEELKNLLNEM
jgi:hypothetical protein